METYQKRIARKSIIKVESNDVIISETDDQSLQINNKLFKCSNHPD